MAAKTCNFPTINIPNPPDIITPIIQALAALGITLPQLPNIPLPKPPCPFS